MATFGGALDRHADHAAVLRNVLGGILGSAAGGGGGGGRRRASRAADLYSGTGRTGDFMGDMADLIQGAADRSGGVDRRSSRSRTMVRNSSAISGRRAMRS